MKKVFLSILFALLSVCGFAQSFVSYRITASAAVVVSQPALGSTIYIYSTGVALGGNWSIATGTIPTSGTRWRVYFDVSLVTNVPAPHTISIFGQNLDVNQIANGGYFDFASLRDHTGLLGVTTISACYVPGSFKYTDVLDGASLIDNTVALDKLTGMTRGYILRGGVGNVAQAYDAGGNGHILIGTGTDINSVNPSGDIDINSAGVTTIQAGVIVNADVNATAGIAVSKLAALTPNTLASFDGGGFLQSGAAGTIINTDINASAAIAWTKLASGSSSYPMVTDGAGYPTTEQYLQPVRGGTGTTTAASTGFPSIAAGVWSVASITDSKILTISFESGEQCNNRIKMPCNGTITNITGYVTKALANTDVGTITLQDALGNPMATGVLTFPLSSALEVTQAATPTTFNTFAAGDVLYVVGAKTTPGGKVLVTLTYTRNN